jgi:hypothetical protein
MGLEGHLDSGKVTVLTDEGSHRAVVVLMAATAYTSPWAPGRKRRPMDLTGGPGGQRRGRAPGVSR